MFAIVEMGGKQYRVEPNKIVYVEKTGKEVGTEFDVEKVLLVEKNNTVSFGTGAKVTARVLEDVKAPKIEGFKYKKKNYHKRWGHRQQMQKIEITSIS